MVIFQPVILVLGGVYLIFLIFFGSHPGFPLLRICGFTTHRNLTDPPADVVDLGPGTGI